MTHAPEDCHFPNSELDEVGSAALNAKKAPPSNHGADPNSESAIIALDWGRFLLLVARRNQPNG